MTAQGGDLLAWLDATITQRENAARAATEGPWEETGIGEYGWTVSAPSGTIVETEDSDQGRANAQFIAANDPESVLRRCAADRKLLARHTPHQSGSMECSMHCERAHSGVLVCNHDSRRWPCPDVVDTAEGYGWTEGER